MYSPINIIEIPSDIANLTDAIGYLNQVILSDFGESQRLFQSTFHPENSVNKVHLIIIKPFVGNLIFGKIVSEQSSTLIQSAINELIDYLIDDQEAKLIEYVVLVDEQNNILGLMPKSQVHSQFTPLHRAFSCFLFNNKNEILLQQRSHIKKTWPLVWSNSVCGHPNISEDSAQAAIRRLEFELGIDSKNIQRIEEVLPYRYCFERQGVVENEICPIVLAYSDAEPAFNLDEVESIRFLPWKQFLEVLKQDKASVWSEWCKEEAVLLNNYLNRDSLL
jgi:isopentenyl-diphosphate Delta-isomerase